MCGSIWSVVCVQVSINIETLLNLNHTDCGYNGEVFCFDWNCEGTRVLSIIWTEIDRNLLNIKWKTKHESSIRIQHSIQIISWTDNITAIYVHLSRLQSSWGNLKYFLSTLNSKIQTINCSWDASDKMIILQLNNPWSKRCFDYNSYLSGVRLADSDSHHPCWEAKLWFNGRSCAMQWILSSISMQQRWIIFISMKCQRDSKEKCAFTSIFIRIQPLLLYFIDFAIDSTQ